MLKIERMEWKFLHNIITSSENLNSPSFKLFLSLRNAFSLYFVVFLSPIKVDKAKVLISIFYFRLSLSTKEYLSEIADVLL